MVSSENNMNRKFNTRTGSTNEKTLLTTASLVVLAGSAFAADLPTRKEAPVAPPPVMSWTGAYAGLSIGYDFGANGNVRSQNWALPISGATRRGVTGGRTPFGQYSMDGSAGNNQNGVIGGVQLGYNYQVGEKIVLGFETDFLGTGISGSSFTNNYVKGSGDLKIADIPVQNSSTSTGTTAVYAGLDYLGTVRGRIGYLVMPNLLVYGTGGFAYGGARAQVSQFASETIEVRNAVSGTGTWAGSGLQTQTLAGWTAGGGLEYMFTPNWSLKGEALYWNLGSMNVNTVGGVIYSGQGTNMFGTTNVNFAGIQAKAGINYHFNWNPAAVVAKF